VLAAVQLRPLRLSSQGDASPVLYELFN